VPLCALDVATRQYVRVDPRHQQLIFDLMLVPGRPKPVPTDEFLRRWPAEDGSVLGQAPLGRAVEDCSSEDVELALVV
jgi:hypothetical protein